MSTNFEKAVAAIDNGDADNLSKLITNNKELLSEQGYQEIDYQFEYFRGASLLHHTAGNPFRCPLPENILEIASILIDAGAPVDATTIGGSTSLDLIVTSAEANKKGVAGQLVSLLLDSGASIDFSKSDLLEKPLAEGAIDAATTLVDRGAKANLCFAAGIGQLESVKSYFDSDGNLIGNRNSYQKGLTNEEFISEAFCFACGNGWQEIADFLLKHGADINWRAKFWGGPTALHLAIYWEHRPMFDFLIEHDADINAKHAQYQSTPLEWSEFLKKNEYKEALISVGAH